MSIPDLIFAVGGLIFAVNLIPTILRQKRLRASTIPLSTSLTTAAVLWSFEVAYAQLDLRLSAATGALTALSWTVLTYQSLRYKS